MKADFERLMGERVYQCQCCAGTGQQRWQGCKLECDWCGGTGWRRECKNSDCYEYGCSGLGICHADGPNG